MYSSVTDSGRHQCDNAKEPTEDEEKQQSATITVLASPEQAKIITGLENDGVAHVALISRNNDKLADELLAEQDKTLQEIYFPETLIEKKLQMRKILMLKVNPRKRKLQSLHNLLMKLHPRQNNQIKEGGSSLWVKLSPSGEAPAAANPCSAVFWPKP